MKKIGNFDYPDRGSFKDALTVAKKALTDYGGAIPYDKAAEALGYTVKNKARMSGYIYKRFDDICMFGLTTRDRGVIRTTDIAVKALDPTDTAKAAMGKAEALRKISILAKVYDAWDGEIPSETAFPAKIGQIANVSWIEAQKSAESLRKLFNEVFPYLKAAPELPAESPIQEQGARREGIMESLEPTTPSPWVEAKVGGVYIRIPRSMKGLETARKLLDLMQPEIPTEEETEEQTKDEPQTD